MLLGPLGPGVTLWGCAKPSMHAFAVGALPPQTLVVYIITLQVSTYG